ncbi:MAG: hypothetical protein KKA31_04990 [Candidatus Margulisbacteria bacterium]|nr:hypothetical protein [Candidatus Margulisiibacteriota bacterium]
MMLNKQKLIIVIAVLFILFGTANSARRTSTNYGLQTDVYNQGGNRGTSESYILRQGSAGQQSAVGSAESASKIAGQGYIYTTNTKPSSPESLQQFRADGVTQIAWPAGWTKTSTEVMKVDISDPDPGDVLVLEIEVVLSGEAFSDTPSFEGGAVNYSGTPINTSVEAINMADNSGYIWQVRVRDLENYYSDWVTLGGDPDFQTDFAPPITPESLAAEALPVTGPAYVYLTWEASAGDSGSGVAGYDLYRSTTPDTGYSKIMSLITGTSTSDTTVILGTDYYYVITAHDAATNESEFSNQASAPQLEVTREAIVAAPATYTGGSSDPVPGSIINYYLYYQNIGFAEASNIVIIDQIPEYTQFKLGTATGESLSAVYFSNDNGSNWDYTPTGTYVDGDVTHIKWEVNVISSEASSKVEYGTVIR